MPVRAPVRRFKRCSSLVFYFRDARFFCRNYLTDVELAAPPQLVEILDHLATWQHAGSLARRLPRYEPRSLARALRTLVRHGLVVEEGSDRARADSALERWAVWSPEAALFHFGTKHTFSGKNTAIDERTYNRRRLAEEPEPPRVKTYRSSPSRALPAVPIEHGDALGRLLLRRRTVRRFSRRAVPLGNLAALLHLTWGFTSRRKWPGLGTVPLKTSPSGGARHPLEVYVVARRVRGLTPAIYHYRPDAHLLERVARSVPPETVVSWCGHQDWTGRCAALFVVTAVFPRVMWRYRFARAYRVVLLEAGHVAQTFCLLATALDLGAFTTAALDDVSVERALGVDGVNESVIYALGVGVPAV